MPDQIFDEIGSLIALQVDRHRSLVAIKLQEARGEVWVLARAEKAEKIETATPGFDFDDLRSQLGEHGHSIGPGEDLIEAQDAKAAQRDPWVTGSPLGRGLLQDRPVSSSFEFVLMFA